jgi:hypothetical protein
MGTRRHHHGTAVRGDAIAARSPKLASTLERLHHWNHVAIDRPASITHRPALSPHTFGHHLGPVDRAVRWLSSTSLSSSRQRDRSPLQSWWACRRSAIASMDAGIWFAHDTLVALFPRRRRIDGCSGDLAAMPTPKGTACSWSGRRRRHPAEDVTTARTTRTPRRRLHAGNGRASGGRIRSAAAARLGALGAARLFVVPSGGLPRCRCHHRCGARPIRRLQRGEGVGGDGITTRTVRTDDRHRWHLRGL